jgi:hypothetical protein
MQAMETVNLISKERIERKIIEKFIKSAKSHKKKRLNAQYSKLEAKSSKNERT